MQVINGEYTNSYVTERVWWEKKNENIVEAEKEIEKKQNEGNILADREEGKLNNRVCSVSSMFG